MGLGVPSRVIPSRIETAYQNENGWPELLLSLAFDRLFKFR